MANIIEIDRINNIIILGTTGTTTRLPFCTANRLAAFNGDCDITNTDLNSWVTGTANQITVTDDTDGTITLSTPQNIDIGSSPQFTGIELGHASDTTLTRVSAGIVAIEGTNIAMVGGAHHDGFSDFVANEHLDWTADQGATNIHSGNYSNTQLSQEQVEDYAGALVANATGTHTGISITYQDSTGDVDFVVDHDAASNFVANEHIDHTSVTLTAGTGLTGGGNISANRTFAVDGLLEDLDTLGANSADSEFLVGTGAGALAWESGATVRTSIGLGTTDNPQFAGLGLGVAATAGTLVVRSLGADGEDIFVVERATSDLLIVNYLADNGTDSCALELKRGGTTLIQLSTRSTDDSYFNMAGDIGIGTTTPDSSLHIKADSPSITFEETDQSNKKWHISGYNANLAFTETGVAVRMTIENTTGDVGIGVVPKTKLTVEGTLTLKEQASADGDTAAYGQIWVKTATPNELWFTDDAGTDHQIAYV